MRHGGGGGAPHRTKNHHGTIVPAIISPLLKDVCVEIIEEIPRISNRQ